MRLFWVEGENEYSIHLARALAEKGYEISHTTGHFITHPKSYYEKAYEGTKVIDATRLYRREDIRADYEAYFVPLTADILNYFAAIERDCYTVSDRCNAQPLSFRDRKTYFRDLIRFWLGYLQAEKIEGVYFSCTPHTVWEIVLMQAARLLSIPAFYMSHTAINNRSLHREGWEWIEEVPENYLDGKNADDVLAMLDAELRKDFEEESVVTTVIKAQNDSFNKLGNLNAPKEALQEEKPPITIKSLLSPLYNAVFRRNARRFYLPLAMDHHSTAGDWNNALADHKKEAAALKEFYANNAPAVDLSQPYVYFPLHLQPELTTQPEAMVFEDHLIALETIAQALPDGWRIYVKENPRQYDTTINAVSGRHFRTAQDLKDMLAVLDKISFVPQSTATKDIIGNAKAVVVLTGTAGWEALTWGKPCIALAYPWYAGCRACLKAQTPEQIKQAFAALPSYTPERVRADLAKFLHYYQDKFFIGSLPDPANIAYNTRPYDDLIAGHAAAIDTYLKAKKIIPYRPAARNS